MESLALLVGVIFLGAILAGLIGFGLSFSSRRGLLITSIVLGVLGFLGGLNLAIPSIGSGARIIGVACASAGLLAITRSSKKLRHKNQARDE